MKFSAETSNGNSLEVEADLNDAVFDAKKRRVEKVQGADVYLTSQQMLVHQGKVLNDTTKLGGNKGKVLNDTTKLGGNNVADNSYLSIMLSEGIPEQADIPPVVRTTAAPPTSGNPLTEAPQATTATANGPTTGVNGGCADGPNGNPEQGDIPSVVRTTAPPTSGNQLTVAFQATTAPAKGPTTGVTGGPANGPNGIPEQGDIPPVVRTNDAPPTSVNPLTEAPQATSAPANGPTTGVTGGPANGPNGNPEQVEIPSVVRTTAAPPTSGNQLTEAPQATTAPAIRPTTGVTGGPANGPNLKELGDKVHSFFRRLEVHPRFKKLGGKDPLLKSAIQEQQSKFIGLIDEIVERGKMGYETLQDIETI